MEPAPGTPASNVVRVAVKNSVSTFFFQSDVAFNVGFKPTGRLGKEEYIGLWKAIAEEHFQDLTGFNADSASVQKKLEARGFLYMATRKVNNQDFHYFYASFCKGDIVILLEVAVGPTGLKACTKTKNTELIPLFQKSVADALR